MKAVLTVEMDNAAFDGAHAGRELARLLKHAAGLVKDFGASDFHHEHAAPLCDINGNKVGALTITGGSMKGMSPRG